MSSNITVLIINENPLKAKALQKQFGRDVHVVCHTTLEEGEQYILRSEPALIITSNCLSIATNVPVILSSSLKTPFSKEDANGLIEFIAKPHANLIALKKKAAELEAEKEHLTSLCLHQSEYLKKAGEVQKSMLKTSQYDDGAVSVYAKAVPLLDLTGDFYYYKRFGDHFYFVIGDVVDHGIEAAIYMTELTSFLFALMQEERELKPLIQSLAHLAKYYNRCTLSATAFFGKLDLGSGELEYCNVSHEAPYLLHADGKVEELSQKEVYLSLGYEELMVETTKTTLLPGEKLFLYTDGLIDEFNSMGAKVELEYGEKRVVEVLEKNVSAAPSELCEKVFKDMSNFIAGNERNDDILMLCIERGGVL